ncbi:hypothetical protein C4544_07560 [candidate division WS5 bacterium]|uniref:Uncharacterized protein n=1 Tax=candidate division WS5 bacterium TaxID=2093353 RepID=A0A419D9P2_9BACT|nr:MAG: hypothetical protein C4544_07560 [candidate division WS5 bacterium]
MRLFYKKNIYSVTSFTEIAEGKLIENILHLEAFSSSSVRRQLCFYPVAIESEKDKIVTDILDELWKIKKGKSRKKSNGSPLFSVFRDFDSVFTILENKGHFIHSFEVFLLGLNIINVLIQNSGGDIFNSRINFSKHIYYSWLLTSSAHDFGYPLEVASELTKKFSLLYKKIYMKDISNQFSDLSKNITLDSSLLNVQGIDIEEFILDGIRLSIIGNNKDVKKIHNVLSEKDNKGRYNHGYISALILCRTYIQYLSDLKILDKKNDAWRVDILKMAAAGIALHAIPKAHISLIKHLSFNLNPLAYLLYLVDNLQDWHRSLRPSKIFPSYSLHNFTSQSNTIHLSYSLYHKSWPDSTIKDTINYLKEKASIIKLPQKPTPSSNFKIVADFLTNGGPTLKSLKVVL